MINKEVEMILDIFSYDKEEGCLFRKKSYHERYIGNTIGTLNGRGYMLTRIGHKKYPIHRLVWIVCNGYIPVEIDHINHIKTDNRIENLREVTRSEQMKNRSMNKNNITGRIGVSIKGNVYRAHIGVNGERIYLGDYSTFKEACIARGVAEKIHNFHINHGA